MKRERDDDDEGHSSEEELGGFQPHGDGARAGKKTKGRVKIKMEFIDNKLRRYTTFSKRKTGIMKRERDDDDEGHSCEEELGGFQPHGDGARAGKKTKGR